MRLPLGRATRTVPGALRTMVRAHSGGAPLQPVAEIPSFTDLDDRIIRSLFKLYPIEYLFEESFGAALPVVPVLMAGSFVHFLHEQRFNRDLLYDLLAKPQATAASKCCWTTATRKPAQASSSRTWN